MINLKINKNYRDVLNLNPKFLWFIALTYSMLSLLSNWFSICTVSLRETPINAGILIYPITFLLSNFIAEIYGYKYARRAIWYGLLFNVLSILYGLWVIYLPSPNYAVHNSLFDSVITTYLKSVYIFVISYFIAEPFNIFFLAKLKLSMNGYYMKLRLVISTILSMTITGIIFNFIASYDKLINIKLMPTIFMATMTIMLAFPILSYLIEKIKQFEEIDIYDQNTQFNFFKFEVKYRDENNEFNKLAD